MLVQACGSDRKTTNAVLDSAGAEYILLSLNLTGHSCLS